jgi:CubicO group peptidase (beta-lactamase class C family)
MRFGLAICAGCLIALASLESAMAQTATPRPLAALGLSGGPHLTGRVLVADGDHILSDEKAGSYGDATVWPWGSVSKQVAAAIVMIEVDKGRLALDDSISTRWKAFPNAVTGAVTLGQLLRHTSGLPNPDETPETDGVPAFYLRREVGRASRDTDATGFCAGPPKRQPGTAFEYNNCDTLVLAGVLESTLGRSYKQLVQDHIARPLGLKSLRLARPNERPIIANAKGVAVPPLNLATFGAAGALLGAPQDLVTFDQALLARKWISPASTAVMWKGDPTIGYVALGAWSFSARLKGCPEPVAMIERRGAVDGVQVRNLIAPEHHRILVVFTDDAEFDFGEIWQGVGPSYVLASEAFCH